MTRLPPGKQWLPHNGHRECRRRMRQSLRRVQKLRDDASQAALARVRAAVADEPEPELGAIHLVHSALLAADGTGCSWAEAMNYVLNRFEERAADAAEAP